MKRIILFLFAITLSIQVNAQKSDKELVTKACMNYLEGFYEGDTNKLKAALQPSLNKFGYWKSNKTQKFSKKIPMTFDAALKFAEDVKKKQNFAKKGAPKEVKILDILEKIAVVKIKAYWGIDYALLSKQENGQWKIEQVIWQGPLEKKTR